MEMVRMAAHFSVEELKYEFIALNRLLVLGVEDATDKLAGIRTAPVKKTTDPVFAFASKIGMEKKATRPPPPQRDGSPKRRRVVRPVLGDDPGERDDGDQHGRSGDDDDDEVDDRGGDSAAEAPDDVPRGHVGDSDDVAVDLLDVAGESVPESSNSRLGGQPSSSSSRPDLGAVIVHGAGGVVHGAGASSSSSSGPSTGGAHAASSSSGVVAPLVRLDEEIADVHEEPPDAEWVAANVAIELPRWNPENHQVTDAETGAILGRIKEMHLGTTKEAISVYCRLHGCSPPLQRTATSPTNQQLVMWFNRGIELGRGPQHKAEHIRMFKELLRR
jgi:hypothetical protein